MILRRRLLAAPLLLATPALAQTQRTIRLIAGFPAGGLADVVARLVAGPLGDALGASVVVENRTGASGTIAADAVAKAAPDGTTLAVSHAIPFGFAPGVLPSLTYDPVADFLHLGMLAEAPTVMVVTARSPFASLPDLLAAARTRPVRFGSSGVGSAEHFMGAVIGKEAGAANLDHGCRTCWRGRWRRSTRRSPRWWRSCATGRCARWRFRPIVACRPSPTCRRWGNSASRARPCRSGSG